MNAPLSRSPHADALSAMSPVLVAMQRQQQETKPADLTDAWHNATSKADNSWIMIKQHRRTLAKPAAIYSNGSRVHSAAYLKHAEDLLAIHERNLVEAGLEVLRCEIEMESKGIQFKRGNEAWRADPLLAAAVFCGGLV